MRRECAGHFIPHHLECGEVALKVTVDHVAIAAFLQGHPKIQ